MVQIKKWIPGICLLLLASCGQGQEPATDNTAQAEKHTDTTIKVSGPTIDTMNTYPAGIEGCSCNFSTDSTALKQGSYIYINDFGELSVMKINGELVRFKHKAYHDTDAPVTVLESTSGAYHMTVEIKEDGHITGEEVWGRVGTITITDDKGHTTVQPFYGVCGC